MQTILRIARMALAGLSAVLLGTTFALAAEPSAAARAEIDHLLSYLGESGCQFFRNGDWFGAAEAKDHLSQKYAYLLKKGLVRDAEDFVRMGAAKSSTSGKPYQVRCEGKPAVPSETWLTEELARYRQQ